MNFDKLINELSGKVPQSEEDTYIGDDGLLHCSKCNGKRQTVVKLEIKGFPVQNRKVNCVCDCQHAARIADEERRNKEFKARRMDEIRRTGFPADQLKQWTFEKDDGSHPKISTLAKNYVEKFEDFKNDGKGLIFYGGVGTGKTFIAAAIANALQANGVETLVTNFTNISNKLQESFDGKQAYMNSLNNFDLLVIDDFGAERKTEYMQEVVFNVIDARYRAGLPMVITTNLGLDAIKSPATIEEKRVMDRVLEKCFPVEVSGGSHRRKNVREQFGNMKDMLGLN